MQKEDLPAGQQHWGGLGHSGLKVGYKDNIRCPFLAAATPAAKAATHNPVAHHLLQHQVSASSYLLIPQSYLGLLNWRSGKTCYLND